MSINKLKPWKWWKMSLCVTELVSSGKRAGRHPPHLGQLQHRQQQPVYPLWTEVDGLEIQTHLCLCTYISSSSKSLSIFLPRSHFRHCVSYAGTSRIEFGVFARESEWVCNQKQVLHEDSIAAVCASWPTKLGEIFSERSSPLDTSLLAAGRPCQLTGCFLFFLLNASFCYGEPSSQICHCFRRSQETMCCIKRNILPCSLFWRCKKKKKIVKTLPAEKLSSAELE